MGGGDSNFVQMKGHALLQGKIKLIYRKHIDNILRPSFPEPLNQFQPNLAEKPCPSLRGDDTCGEYTLTTFKNLLFFRTAGQFKPNLAQRIVG